MIWWYPQSVFEWCVVGYLLIGLLWSAYAYHEGTSEEGQEQLRKELGPLASLPPNLIRVAMTIGDIISTVFFTAAWPLFLIYYIYDFAYDYVVDAWCYLFHDHSDEDEEVNT